MSLDRTAPRGYRRAWNGGSPPPSVPLGVLSMKLLAPLTVGEQVVIQPNPSGCLVARRALSVVAISEAPGDMLTVVQGRAGIAVGTVASISGDPISHAILDLS